MNEWWVWHKFNKGPRTLSSRFAFAVKAPVDYRRRMSTRSSAIEHSLKVIGDRVKESVANVSTGSMAMFATFPRVGDTMYTQCLVTPPIFHIDTIRTPLPPGYKHLVNTRDPVVAFPIWLQPWLQERGRQHLFFGFPYDETFGYQDLSLAPVEALLPYKTSEEVRSRIAVAVDAFLQTGQPDERFQAGECHESERFLGVPAERCEAIRGMESWQPSCSLRPGHDGAHRWTGPSLNDQIDGTAPRDDKERQCS